MYLLWYKKKSKEYQNQKYLPFCCLLPTQYGAISVVEGSSALREMVQFAGGKRSGR